MAKKNLTDSLKVKSPCSQNWNAMKGGDKIRFCEHCNLSVNNISAMTRKEALRLARQSNSDICVRYIKNPRTNSPVFADKLYQISRRAGIAAGVLSASLAMATAAYAQGGVSVSENLNDKNDTADVVQDKIVKAKKNESSTISGTIPDRQGAVIPEANVTLIDEKTNESRTVTANEEGFYEFKDVATGDYKINVEAGLFKNAEINNLVIADGNDNKSSARQSRAVLNRNFYFFLISVAELRGIRPVRND